MEETQLQIPNIPASNSSASNNGNRIFTCNICVEEVPEERKFNGCCRSHSYCTSCVAKFVQVQVTHHNISEITCPAINCEFKLDPSSCQSLLPKSVFEKWCRALCESQVFLDSSKGGLAYGRSYCPYRNCSELVLNECVESKITKSNCPSCKNLFCFHCMAPWKEKHRCTSDGGGETIIDIDDSKDDLFMKIVKQNRWRRCPSCHHYVERKEGCKHMTCRCRTAFCYDCGSSSCICKKQQWGCEEILLWVIMSFMVLGSLLSLGVIIYLILVLIGLVPDPDAIRN